MLSYCVYKIFLSTKKICVKGVVINRRSSSHVSKQNNIILRAILLANAKVRGQIYLKYFVWRTAHLNNWLAVGNKKIYWQFPINGPTDLPTLSKSVRKSDKGGPLLWDFHTLLRGGGPPSESVQKS